jgi:hypothetical protein
MSEDAFDDWLRTTFNELAEEKCRDAFNAGRASMLAELRAKVPTEADMHQMSLQHCCDWPQEVYHPNDLRGFYEAGLKALQEKIFGGVDDQS